MSMSLRAIQSAANAGGLNVPTQNALLNMRPVILQNYLRGTYSVTSSTTLANVGVGTQASIAAGSQLQVQVDNSILIADNGEWEIEGELYMTGVLVGIGMKMALAASDGLTFANTGNSGLELLLQNTGTAPVLAYGFASAALSTTVSTTAVFTVAKFHGMVQFVGTGMLSVQAAQNASTGTAIVVGAGSWIKATAVLPMEH